MLNFTLGAILGGTVSTLFMALFNVARREEEMGGETHEKPGQLGGQ